MISGSVAKTNSDTTTGSLSYINNLVTGATSSGSYNISVSNRYMNDTMATLLRSYGYNVTTKNDNMGTNNDYVITWGTVNVPTPTPTATATATPIPTATPTPTPIALDFTIGSYCEQSPKMLSVTVRSIIGGTSLVGYQISKTTFSSQADAEANTEWLNVVDSDIITNPINGTYWVSVKDSSGTVKAKSTSVSCFPTPTPTPTSTSTPTPTATVAPTPTPTSNRVAGVDFTIEWWMKANSFTSPSYFPRPYSLGSFPAPNAVSIENSGNNIYWWTNNSAKISATSLNLQTNTWYHIAVTRDNGALSLYVDGVRKATATYNDTIPSSGNTLYIGAEPYTGGTKNYVNGKMTNYRWNASVKYSGASFTVPTSPLTADADTKLLLLATNSGGLLTDSSTLTKTVTNNGATFSTDSPFVSGGGSLDFAGTGYVTIPASSDWDL